MRLHSETRNIVVFHHDVARRLAPQKAAAQVNAAAQRVGLVFRVVAPRLRRRFVAMRQVHVQQPVVRDRVARAECQNAGVLHAVEQVADHPDAVRPRMRIAVVE